MKSLRYIAYAVAASSGIALFWIRLINEVENLAIKGFLFALLIINICLIDDLLNLLDNHQ